jgi:hypothetical protein
MKFDYNRLRFGETVAAGSAILLFFCLFLNWYSASLGNAAKALGFTGKVPDISTSVSGWQAFSYTDLLLLLLIIVAVALAVLKATERTPALPVAGSVILTAFGALMTLLVLYRIVNQPGPNNVVNVEYGAYIGFLLTAGITYGGFLSMREEGTSFSDAKAQAEDMVGSRGTTTPPASAPPASSSTPGSTAPPSTAPPAAAPPATPPPAAAPPATTPPVVDPGEPPAGGAPPAAHPVDPGEPPAGGAPPVV